MTDMESLLELQARLAAREVVIDPGQLRMGVADLGQSDLLSDASLTFDPFATGSFEALCALVQEAEKRCVKCGAVVEVPELVGDELCEDCSYDVDGES
jgi:hypothetical protein